MPHILGDLFAQEGSEHPPSLRRAGRAEPPTGTGEGQQILALAGVTHDPGEAVLEVTAVNEGVDDSVYEAAPVAVGVLFMYT